MNAPREERPGDIAAIDAVVRAAFDGHPHSDGSEPAIVERLRHDGDLTLSLVIEDGDRVIGHVAFSPVRCSAPGRWFGLGPVAVSPDCQRQGLGRALIAEGLQRLRGLGAAGCVVMGDPAYYGRFGFETDERFVYPGAPAEYFTRLAFTPLDDAAGGPVAYAPAFGGPSGGN